MKEVEDLEVGTFPIKRVDISTRFKVDADKFYLPLATIVINNSESIEVKNNQHPEETEQVVSFA